MNQAPLDPRERHGDPAAVSAAGNGHPLWIAVRGVQENPFSIGPFWTVSKWWKATSQEPSSSSRFKNTSPALGFGGGTHSFAGGTKCSRTSSGGCFTASQC